MKKIIPFLTFCLVVTCNAELRTWIAVNGKEVEAEFVSNEEGIVKLKLNSGKIFDVVCLFAHYLKNGTRTPIR